MKLRADGKQELYSSEEDEEILIGLSSLVYFRKLDILF